MGTGNQTTRLIVQLGDGDDPEVFAHTCGANTFGISLANNLGENIMLDCDDPLDVPAAIVRHLESQDTVLHGAAGRTMAPRRTSRSSSMRPP